MNPNNPKTLRQQVEDLMSLEKAKAAVHRENCRSAVHPETMWIEFHNEAKSREFADALQATGPGNDMPRELTTPWRGPLPSVHTPESIAAALELVRTIDPFSGLSDEELADRQEKLRQEIRSVEGEMVRRGAIPK